MSELYLSTKPRGKKLQHSVFLWGQDREGSPAKWGWNETRTSIGEIYDDKFGHFLAPLIERSVRGTDDHKTAVKEAKALYAMIQAGHGDDTIPRMKAGLRHIRTEVFRTTQIIMGQIGGVSESQISRFEAGTHVPDWLFLSRIARFANLTGHDLDLESLF